MPADQWMDFREIDVPMIICWSCGVGAWVQHEALPGGPTLFECSICGRSMGVEIVGAIPRPAADTASR